MTRQPKDPGKTLRAPRKPASSYDPTGIDDGEGGIALGERRPALRATAWIALIVVVIAIVVLAWRTVERQSVERAYADGVQALASGRLIEAQVAFDRAIAKRPGWGAAWRQRGYAAATPDEAIADFTRAITLDPDDAEALAARGRAWMRAGQPAKGAEDLSRALAIARRSSAEGATMLAWRADLGLARFESGDTAGAIDDLRHAAEARGTPEDHHRLALALASGGDWSGARMAYDRAVVDGTQPLWFGERALVMMRVGDDDAAGVDLVRCAQLDPACAELFGPRAGQLARELGRPPPVGAR